MVDCSKALALGFGVLMCAAGGGACYSGLAGGDGDDLGEGGRPTESSDDTTGDGGTTAVPRRGSAKVPSSRRPTCED